MRLVDFNYKPLAQDHNFQSGEKLLLSEDAWCSYSTDVVEIIDSKPVAKEHNRKIVWQFDPYLNDSTWCLDDQT